MKASAKVDGFALLLEASPVLSCLVGSRYMLVKMDG